MPKATLAQRKDNRFRCRYKGKEFYGATQKEAFDKRDAYIDLVKHGLKPEAITVREYSAIWLPTHKNDVKRRTYNTYAHYLDEANNVIGDIPVIKVTPTDVRRAYNVYAGKSQSSIDKLSDLLIAMFSSAVRDGYARVNPCDEVDKPKGTTGSHRALTEEEDALILKVDHPLRLAVLFMRYAGLRRGEVIALTMKDVDMKEKIIHVTKAVSYDGNKPILGLPKTDAGIRDVPLFTCLESAIKGHIGHVIGKDVSQTSFKRAWESYVHTVEKEINGCQKRWYGRRRIDKKINPEKYERYTKLLKEAEKYKLYNKFNKEKKALEEAEKVRLEGWKDFTVRPHDLRHSFVTMLCDAYVDIDYAMQIVGHADERMIRHIYDHVSEYRKKKAIGDVEALLKEKRAN